MLAFFHHPTHVVIHMNMAGLMTAVDCYVIGTRDGDGPADQGSWKQTELKQNAVFVCDHGCCKAVQYCFQLERATAG